LLLTHGFARAVDFTAQCADRAAPGPPVHSALAGRPANLLHLHRVEGRVPQNRAACARQGKLSPIHMEPPIAERAIVWL
jgi:hypothetical protein